MSEKKSSVSEQLVSNDDHTQIYKHNDLVWLDENIENSGMQKNRQRWHQLYETLDIFTNKTECIDYIRRQSNSNANTNIIFIVSASLTQEILPKIHDCACVLDIFIFAPNGETNQNLRYQKIRAVCSDIDELFDRIQHFKERNNVSLGFNLFNNQDNVNLELSSIKSTPDKQSTVRNIKEDQARFLWFYKCSSFMIELNDDDELAKIEMIECFRNKYKDDKLLISINQFQKESLDENAEKAIWWYTSNSIIYQYINELLVSGNIVAIYSCRYIIKLLCRQLRSLHKEFIKTPPSNMLRLYRGQRLKLEEILLLSKHIHDFISLNSFVSTTLDIDVSNKFNFGRNEKYGEPVLFIIDIDMNAQHSTEFADISKYSRYEEEEEILISIGSIFRIESVVYIDNSKLYEIHLSLKQHDQLTVNEYIEQAFSTEVDSTDQSVLFGKLLFDMGEYSFAIKYFENQTRSLSDSNNRNRPTYLNNLGVCYDEIGDRTKALKCYKMASTMYQATKNERGLGACYHNMANCYYNQGDYVNALKWALDALHERHKYALAKASTLDLLGCIQSAQHDSEAACNNVKEALKIRLRFLGQTNPNHPDIGISYFNLGKLDYKLSSLIEAERNYSRALEIFKVNYPKAHPLINEVTKRLEELKQFRLD